MLRAFYAISCFVYWLALQVLPLSMSSLLLATQLAFSAVFAFFFGGLRLTPFLTNAIVLLSIGLAVLGVGPGSERPAGQSSSTYWTGFCEAIGTTLARLVLLLAELAMALGRRRRREA